MISEPYKFTTHHVRISLDKINQPLYLHPIGDVHDNCEFHDRQAFNETLAKCKARLDSGDKCAFYLMGDELEGMSRKERRALVMGNFHDATYLKLSQCFENEINTFVSKTAFMTTHENATLIGGVEGNHRGVIRRSKDESWKNSYDYMFEKYAEITPKGKQKPKNLGGMNITRLTLDVQGQRSGITICAVHGETIGGGRTKGGSINAVAKLTQVARANLYMAGHNHDKQASPGEVFELKTFKGASFISAQPVRYVRTGCYRRSYVDGESCYPARSAYPPSIIGTPEIVLTPTRRQDASGKVVMSVKIRVNDV